MAKLIKVSDSKAYRVSLIRMADDKENTVYLSIRQLYKTKKEPDDWKPGYQGITFPLGLVGRVLKAVKKVSEGGDEPEVIKKKEK